jgi:hypothetical protein
MAVPPPQASPQPPSPADEDSGVRPALVRDVKEAIAAAEADKPSTVKVALIAGITLLGGAGGAIVFLLAFAGESRAQAVKAAEGIASVQAQRIDVVKGDVDALKARVEAVDAGTTKAVQDLRDHVDRKLDALMEAREKDRELMLRVLTEVKKR